MDSVEGSRKVKKPRTVFTKRSTSSSPPSRVTSANYQPLPPSEEPQPSTFKRMKRKRNGNVDPAVTSLDPLLIPDVVENISGHLVDMEDMRNIHSLNRLWRDESLKHWRSTAVLVLTEEVIQALVQAYFNPTEESVNRFFKLFERPFLNFRYPSDSDGRNRVYPLQPMDIGGPSQILWEQFFSKAKYLDLGDCLLKDDFYFFQGFEWIVKTCRELKRLDLNPYEFSGNLLDIGDEEENTLGSSNKALSVPNLETLSIGKSLTDSMTMAGYSDYFPPWLQYPLFNFFNQAEADGPINPFPELLQLCPNLKNLWMQGDSDVMLRAAISERHQFESLTFVPEKAGYFCDIYFLQLHNYLKEIRPPLKTLVLRLDSWKKCFTRPTEQKPLFEILNLVQGTLTKLELYIDCEIEGIFKRPLKLASEGGQGTRTFSNLTHLKICQDYRKFKGNLISFDFGSLRQMKKLKEFRFEMGIGVAESWVKTKLGVKDIQGKKKKGVQLEELLLPDLKHFHFHSNFTSEAVKVLGKVSTNLKTLEVVLDDENYRTALKTWPGLQQITLLPCSEVSKASEPLGLKIVDRSKDYRKASPSLFNRDSPAEFTVRQMKRFGKITKPR